MLKYKHLIFFVLSYFQPLLTGCTLILLMSINE